MIRKLLLGLFIVLMSATLTFANPLLYAEPWDNVTTFYKITIDGIELQENIPAEEEFDWVFFFDIGAIYLNDGAHEVWIRSCNDNDESEDVKFLIVIRTFKNFRQYEIKLDRKNNKEDPFYTARFDEPLIVKIPIR